MNEDSGKILVIDDDVVSLRFVSSLLREKGYDVLVAEDGQHGWHLAVTQKPDLIVTDLVMPYRDGFQLLQAIRDDRELSKVPVIVLSMRDHEEDVVRGLDDGADDYIVKPFNARELLSRIRKQLDRRRGPG
jgi:DNA-binding response OmpR family regulator